MGDETMVEELAIEATVEEMAMEVERLKQDAGHDPHTLATALMMARAKVEQMKRFEEKWYRSYAAGSVHYIEDTVQELRKRNALLVAKVQACSLRTTRASPSGDAQVAERLLQAGFTRCFPGMYWHPDDPKLYIAAVASYAVPLPTRKECEAFLHLTERWERTEKWHWRRKGVEESLDLREAYALEFSSAEGEEE